MMYSLATQQEVYTPTTAKEFITHMGGMHELLNIRQQKVRNDIIAKVEAMLAIEHYRDKGLKIKEAIDEVTLRAEGVGGFSKSRLSQMFALWRKGGKKQNAKGKKEGTVYKARDWRMFVPNYNNGNYKAVVKNDAFKEFIIQLFGDTSRADATGEALQARLLDKWYDGESIPGFGTIFEWHAEQGRSVATDNVRRASDYPSGWSTTNLLRLIKGSQTKAAISYMQLGEHKAHDHWGDQLLRDRSNLMPFQLITFDDVRFDIRVIMDIPGKKPQIVYPEAIFCLDVATGMILAKGVMGSYTRHDDSDGGKKGTKRGFQQADMRMLMHSVLERYGLPVNWKMKVLLENASASLSEADKKVFTSLTGIEFEQTGIIRRKLVESGFVEQGGMPWSKGWVESFFRKLHCRINHLPATTGSRYDLTKGSVGDVSQKGSQVHYTIRCIEEAQKKGIPISELNLPILTLQEFHDLLDEYVLRLNWRTKHKLQGFEKVYEFEYLPGKFMRHDDPNATQIISADTNLLSRMESPIERGTRLMQGHRMDPLHPQQLFPLAMEKKPITVRAERVTIKSSIHSNDSLVFRDEKSAQKLAEWNGKEKALLGFLSHDASCIHLFSNDDNLEWIASPARVGRVDLTDDHAILKRAGEVNAGRQRIRDEVANILQPKDDEYTAMRSHNNTLLGQQENEQETTLQKRGNNVSESILKAESRTRDESEKNKQIQQVELGNVDDLLTVVDEQETDIDQFDSSILI